MQIPKDTPWVLIEIGTFLDYLFINKSITYSYNLFGVGVAAQHHYNSGRFIIVLGTQLIKKVYEKKTYSE
jgi:hypothetical protein